MIGTVKKIIGIVVLGMSLVSISFLSGLVYIVDETQQVVITQFGRPVGNPITTAGMHFKIPVVQQVTYFEKRILDWDGDPNQIPTKDKKYIWVDSYARWRISNALEFMQSVGNEVSAHARLDDIINSAARDVITNHLLVEAIRDTNRILDIQEEEDVSLAEEALDKINVGRSTLETLILAKARNLAPQYGIELVDTRIKRINYVEEVRNKVYDRMVAERKRAAERYRSEGQGKSAEINGELTKELKSITSEAYRKAEGIKGKADAEVISIYAQAYGQDSEFYSFVKTLETYRDTIDEDSTIILTTDAEYFKYLKNLE